MVEILFAGAITYLAIIGTNLHWRAALAGMAVVNVAFGIANIVRADRRKGAK
jgi:hypothetical protein